MPALIERTEIEDILNSSSVKQNPRNVSVNMPMQNLYKKDVQMIKGMISYLVHTQPLRKDGTLEMAS